MAQLPGMIVRAEPDALLLQLFDEGGDGSTGVLVRMSFEGSSSNARLLGEGEGEAIRSYFIGADPGQWHAGVPCFSMVRYESLYEGIDLVLRSNSGRLKYDLLCAPGADLDAVRFRLTGAEGLSVRGDGALIVHTVLGELVQPRGRTWQMMPSGEMRPLTSRFVMLDENTFGVAVDDWSPDHALVIDPELRWSTYLGSSFGPGLGDELAYATAFGPGGDVYVTGKTNGSDFPTTPGTYQSYPFDGGNIFVTRFRGSDGALVYSSVMGGDQAGAAGGNPAAERPQSLRVDGTGRATVAGWTEAANFPTTGHAFQQVKLGTRDGFVLRLSALGDALEFSTYLGGVGSDVAFAVDVAPSGATVVGGFAVDSPDFPTTAGAYQTSMNGTLGIQSFITRLDPTGSFLEWSTFLGGSGGEDGVMGLRLDANEDVTVAGKTTSADFPTTPGAWDTPSSGPGWQIFVTRLNAQGSDLVWSSVFGGYLSSYPEDMALEASGAVVVTGWTAIDDFPTTPGAFQEQFSGISNFDSFVVRLDPTGSFPLYSTYLPSSRAWALDVDASGLVTVAGSPGIQYPITPGAFDELWETPDAFVTRLNPSGSELLYSTYLGGPGTDYIQALAVGPTRTVAAAGYSTGGYPVTPGAYDTTFNGGQIDVVVTTFDLLLEGVETFGESTPACLGPLAAGVTEMPVAGAQSFGFYCSGAPPDSYGFLGLGSPGTVVVPGGVSAASAVRVFPVESDGYGWTETPFPIPAGVQGVTISCRYVFLNTGSCPGSGPWSSSNGLTITVQ